MKRINVNRFWLMALGIFVTIMLFILGRHDEAHAMGLAETAMITLSAEEKEGLSEDEQKFMLALKKSVAQQIADAKKNLIDKAGLDNSIREIKEGLSIKEWKDLTEMLKAQGVLINELKEANKKPSFEDPLEKFKKEIEEAADELQEIRSNKSGQKAFIIKVAAVTSTTGAAPSLVNTDISAAAALRLGEGPINEIPRGLPFILNFVSVGRTDSSVLVWFDELPKEGDFAVTAEGAIKPLIQYFFERRVATYRKAAGYTAITEEFDKDFPRLVSTIKRLMEIDCRNKMNDIILGDMITQAVPYAYPAMDDQVDNADDYGAIGAAVAQIQSTYGTPNVLVLNPADAWRVKLTKATDGHYVMPPFTWNGQTYEFGKVIIDPRVAVGKFLLGDGSVYFVDLRGDVIVRIGYANDDFIRNQYSMVVEQYFYNYISTSRKKYLIYGDFATIKTAIEKP